MPVTRQVTARKNILRLAEKERKQRFLRVFLRRVCQFRLTDRR
ncbi:hypothetical protein RMSM_00070 [Rhodopirellula maiorica SM1]|uniref:Uncharacterized protein n=1 Tax=Rhodopirellula maiorica SM1 TaxID=1265738 RepID=M5S9Z8_9BACT|nr:hypothetical protein RMSM_00070 [Rhodopirellula maiorica SM1]